jgi:hypothetical protein
MNRMKRWKYSFSRILERVYLLNTKFRNLKMVIKCKDTSPSIQESQGGKANSLHPAQSNRWLRKTLQATIKWWTIELYNFVILIVIHLPEECDHLTLTITKINNPLFIVEFLVGGFHQLKEVLVTHIAFPLDVHWEKANEEEGSLINSLLQHDLKPDFLRVVFGLN